MNTIVSPNRDLLSFVNMSAQISPEEADEIIRSAMQRRGKAEQPKRELLPAERFKQSVFNVGTRTESGYILFNTFYNSICRLTDDERAMLESMSAEGTFRDELAEYGFIVDERADELDVFLRAGRIFREAGFGRECAVIVATTTDCNARCAYCFEDGARREYMTDETALRTADWIAGLPFSGVKERGVTLTWFGGEPLMHTRPNDLITSRLDELGVKYSSFMITNGTLLDTIDIAECAERWHLRTIQVTIDGAPGEFARRKNFPDGSGVRRFYDLLNSIERITKETDIHFSVRLNIDRGNAGVMPELAGRLAGIFADNERVNLYPAFVSGTGEPLSHSEKAEAALAVYKAAGNITRSSAFRAIFEMPKFSPCHYCSPGAFAVDAAGCVYSCEHNVGRPEKSIGTVFEDFTSMRNGRTVPPEHEKCLRCAFLPKCGGGCHGNFEAGDEPCFEVRYVMSAYLEML